MKAHRKHVKELEGLDRGLAALVALECLVQLEILPPPCRRKRSRYDTWIGLAFFMPSYLFVICKLLTG
jgi:hypothetical protein